MLPLLAILVTAALAPAATTTPIVVATTPSVSPVAAERATEPVGAASPTASVPPTTTARRTPRPTPTPEEDVAEPTPLATATAPDADPAPETLAPMIPTAQPLGAVRTFRTPERAAPPPFVAPKVELPAEEPDAPVEGAETDSLPPPDEPYVATVTFRAVAGTEVSGFGLMIIYPRSDGDFVGTGNGTECRAPGDAALVADDNDQGMLRLRVTGTRALAFPLDVVCRFTVAPRAVLQARVIAVNVTEVVTPTGPGETSTVAVSVLAH